MMGDPDPDLAAQRVGFAIARTHAAVDQIVAQRDGACRDAAKWRRRCILTWCFFGGCLLGALAPFALAAL